MPNLIDIEEIEEDIEAEVGNEEVKVDVPFDPSEINIKIISISIGQLVEKIEHYEILIPKYQSSPNLWNNIKKSRFIESLMLNLPIPLFYFDETTDYKWSVVDGLQRMSTLEHFVIGKGELSNNKEKLLLQNLEFFPQHNGKSWNDLPRDIQRRVYTHQVMINLIGKGTPDEVKYTIFSRINQGDVPLKAQEIRTALFQGHRVDFLESLASPHTESGRLFADATGGSVKARRQEDLNFISRFIAFYLTDFNKYEPDMDRFITKVTKDIPKEKIEQEKIRTDFNKSMQLAIDIFGKFSFRKRVDNEDIRKPINKPIFEVIAVAFAKLNHEEINRLKQNKDKFVQKFIDLQKPNTTFFNAITTGTATKDSVLSRNKEFRAMLKTFIS